MSNNSENRPNDDSANADETTVNAGTPNAKGPGPRNDRGKGQAGTAARLRVPIMVVAVIVVVLLALVAVVPPLYSLILGTGVKTEGIQSDGAEPASTDVNGSWTVIPGDIPNYTSAGFTFDEILPGEEKTTSGSTYDVTGTVEIADNALTTGLITVDMSNITTDQEKRDINVRMKLLNTDEFPTATFEVTEPVDLSGVPDDGTVGQVVVPGELTIHGQTNEVTPTFDVLRDGNQVIIASDIEINRLDFGVETPEFVAAKVDEMGEINVRLALEK